MCRCAHEPGSRCAGVPWRWVLLVGHSPADREQFAMDVTWSGAALPLRVAGCGWVFRAGVEVLVFGLVVWGVVW